MANHNPRIDDIATRVDTLQAEGFPFLSAVTRVAEQLEISVSTVDSCYGAALSGIYDDLSSEVEYWLGMQETHPMTAQPYVDPFDTTVDDWDDSYWR